MGSGGSNLERLQEAGVIDPEIGELPVPYARFVDGLTREEVDVLIAVRQRLLAADEWQTKGLQQDTVAIVRPPY